MIDDPRPIVILIAEADQLIRMVTADMLEDAGFQVREVRTADEALTVIKQEPAVRVLITGRSIVGDGVALAHLVHHQWPAICVIVTSGARGDLQRDLPPGVRLLSKPYDSADVIREVTAGLAALQEEPAAAHALPVGVPPHMGAEIASGTGAIAAPLSEPDKS